YNELYRCSSIPMTSIFLILLTIVYAIWFLVSGTYVILIKGKTMTFVGTTSYDVGNIRYISSYTIVSSKNVAASCICVLYRFGSDILFYFQPWSPSLSWFLNKSDV